MKGQKENPHGGNRGAQRYMHTDCNNSSLLQQATSLQAAMSAAGLSTKDRLIADGKLRRFYIEGDRPGTKNGWYVLYVDSLPAGAFGSWRTGESFKWCAKTRQTMTAAEQAEFIRRMDEARKARHDEEERRHREAQCKALAIWQNTLPARDDHPYLVRKRVRNHGLRLHKAALVVPLWDSAGTLHSLQFIHRDASKSFLSGGRKKGCFFLMGNLTDSLCIAEGYATAASIHEATGLPVAVAFDAGNLLPVAQVLREKFPHTKIILCADNDTKTPGNPGLSKAREAAAAIRGLLAVPPCAGDFNDLLIGGAA